jgi:adenylate cyclase
MSRRGKRAFRGVDPFHTLLGWQPAPSLVYCGPLILLRGTTRAELPVDAAEKLTDPLDTYRAIDGARILVVDDNHPVRYVVRRYLQRCKATIVEAENGKEAVELALQEHPDLILMDVDMPVMDGMAACRILRADPATRSIPVIFLTGRDDDERHMEALLAGGDDFIAKPFTAPILLARIANMVQRHRAEQEVKRLLELVHRYVSKPVREATGTREVEQVEATILFSDLRGFTATSMHEDPQRVFRAISDVLANQTNAVLAEGGYVDKFSGDGMLAVFEGEDCAAAACRAATEIVRWARHFEGISFWQPPPIGLGIHHGIFLRGDLGGDQQREYTVIGGTVNIAARLCGVAQALEVIVSDVVAARVGDRYEFEPARLVNLKGLAEDARIYPLCTPT